MLFDSEETGKLGFGCMRLPTEGGYEHVDHEAFCGMIDRYLEQGFRYFDTAYPYHGGHSETALRECLVKRYPRRRFVLADKVSPYFVKYSADMERVFGEQLQRCGVDYFDIYMLHNMGVSSYKMAMDLDGFSFLRRKKAEGKIRYIGFSFHDTPELLEQILGGNPDVDLVQIQLNYVDWDNPSVQSRRCYEVLQRHHKPAVVMEPVKGGGLASLPEEARAVLSACGPGSCASFAIRYAASLSGVKLVLSGMSTLQQVEDNTATMKRFIPLCGHERDAIEQVKVILSRQHTIACTNCRYCVQACARNIHIPNLFSLYNQLKQFGDTNFLAMHYQKNTSEQGFGKASDCIGDGRCEEACPQHLPIRTLLKQVAEAFEKR